MTPTRCISARSRAGIMYSASDGGTGARTPLFDALCRHCGRGRASFHTPGHKGRAPLLERLRLLEHDLTELPDTGSLYDGGDAIELAELRAERAFGAALTLFSAGGCTLCIQTMLQLGAGGGKVLMARNAHRSAVHAAALLGLQPEWVWPPVLADGEVRQVTAQAIEEKLSDNRDIRAVYLTSPDYTGNLADIARISAVCRNAGAKLLVDNAHGSHLGAFRRHPLALGADMTADSAHKTLPVLTGGAMLHIGNAREAATISRLQAKAAMALFGSTSPPFPVLASLDLAREWWETEGMAAYQDVARAADRLRRSARQTGVEAFDDVPYTLRDPVRLTLDTGRIGISGTAASSYFRTRGCEPETSDDRYVVFILTPFNTHKEMGRLAKAITELEAAAPLLRCHPGRPAFSAFIGGEIPEVILPVREALLRPLEEIPVRAAAGRVSARSVCPCPPGVAAVVPGERIGGDMAAFLESCGYERLFVVKSL